MSSTRTALDPGEIRQERFSSSADLRGDFLLGNLVARRCALLDDPQLRRLVWFVQDLSTRQGMQTHPTCNQFPAWPLPLPLNHKGETGLDLLALEIVNRSEAGNSFENLRSCKEWLIRFCLDPESEPINKPHKITAVSGVLKCLAEIVDDARLAPLAKVAETATKRALWDLLDYGLSSRGLVLCEGTYRVGKSFCAQAWTMAHAGEARYVQLSSARDEEAFYRQIARSLGVACSLKRRSAEIRERVEATLQEQQIMLVIDEAAFTLPQATRTRHLPHRLCWLITACSNRGVPVALIASRDFSRIMENMRRQLPIFGQEQFYGRLRMRIDLPDVLSGDDLAEIAGVLAPEADEATRLLLAGLALRHTGFISTIEAVVSRARFLAEKQRRPLNFRFVEAAMIDIDPTYKPASAVTSRDVRDGSAIRFSVNKSIGSKNLTTHQNV